MGTNYYTAGTNKDWRAQQIYEGIEERELALYFTNAPTVAPRFYIWERSNCVQSKAWITAQATQFVDLTRTTSNNIVRWSISNLLADCALPTNFLTYTPWQQLNGVGYGYTNTHTASGYTTLAYGWAGVTSIFKRLTAVTRRGEWVARTNDGLWGRGWMDVPVAAFSNQGLRNDSDIQWDDFNEVIISSNVAASFHQTRANSITESLAYEQVQWLDAITNVSITHQTNQSAITGATNWAPEIAASILTITNWFPFGIDAHRATWIYINSLSYAPLATSTSTVRWRLFVRASVPSLWMAGDQMAKRTYDDFGAGFATNTLTVAQTGLVTMAGAVYSFQPVVTNGITAGHFPTNVPPSMYMDAWFAGDNLIWTDGPGFSGPPNFGYAETRGYTIVDWLYLLDYEFTRK